MTRHLFLLSFMLQRGIKVDFAWQSKSSFAPFVRKAHAQGVYALFADVHAGRASARRGGLNSAGCARNDCLALLRTRSVH